MQSQLDSLKTALPIRILGVNAVGLESGNATICAGRTLPWLQDVTAVDAWSSWGVTFRDVVILDGNNLKVGVYNLTVHDLADSSNYAELKHMLLTAASSP